LVSMGWLQIDPGFAGPLQGTRKKKVLDPSFIS
jgi:hypothetical protein